MPPTYLSVPKRNTYMLSLHPKDGGVKEEEKTHATARGAVVNKMAYTSKDPHPPQRFLYLRETKSWRCEGGGEEEEGRGGENK